MKKEKTRAWWIKELDSWFSKYIRLKYDKGRCYTCGYVAPWKRLQNGHMVSRYYLSTRFDERNCRPQCYTCNMFRKGMIPDFSQRLEKELGDGITKELYKIAQRITKDFDIQFLQEKVSYYKTEVEGLINKKDVL